MKLSEKTTNEEMIDKGLQAIEACDEYYNAMAKEHGKAGFIYLKHNETGQLVVYTRGEYTDKILKFLETLE